ncbi:MAG: opacity protein-like surface antigen [Halieaceae bacterium]|jgi:opacity protein-like surface antigen
MTYAIGMALAVLICRPTVVLADALYLGVGGYLADMEVAAGSDSDFTPAGFVGYQFLDSSVLMLSAELGYYDLGSSAGSFEDLRYSVDASALTLAGVAYLPLGPFIEVYAKAGAAFLDVETRIGTDKRTDDSSELFLGAGLALDFFDTVDIYVEYLRFDNLIDSQMVGVGIRLDFF